MEEEKNNELNKEQVKNETARLINKIVEEKLDIDNVDLLYKLVDVHKDISNEEYWKVKEEKYMRGYNEGGYSGYERRGGYSEGGNYGRRGVRGSGRGRYRGYGNDPEEMMEEMKEHYMAYSEGREQYNRGNSYNGEEQMIEATEGIMENVVEIVEKIAQGNNPEVMKIIQKYTRKMMEM